MPSDFGEWEALQPGSEAEAYLPTTTATVRWGRLFCIRIADLEG